MLIGTTPLYLPPLLCIQFHSVFQGTGNEWKQVTVSVIKKRGVHKAAPMPINKLCRKLVDFVLVWEEKPKVRKGRKNSRHRPFHIFRSPITLTTVASGQLIYPKWVLKSFQATSIKCLRIPKFPTQLEEAGLETEEDEESKGIDLRLYFIKGMSAHNSVFGYNQIGLIGALQTNKWFEVIMKWHWRYFPKLVTNLFLPTYCSVELNKITTTKSGILIFPRFVKLHVPMEMLKRYAEILKLRMKLKVGAQTNIWSPDSYILQPLRTIILLGICTNISYFNQMECNITLTILIQGVL